MGAMRDWAKGLSQEEQEEWLADPVTGKVRQGLSEHISSQRHRLVEACRTRDLPALRWEAGFLDGLKAVEQMIEDES